MKKLKAFTMLEILMITIIVGVWLLSIVVAITKAKTITNETKQEIIATQLAKEWIEMVYQMRNSNLLQHPNHKEKCRLYINKDTGCRVDNTVTYWTLNPFLLRDGNYIIDSWNNITGTLENLNISDWIQTWEQIFNICLTWWKRISCPWQNNDTQYWRFFRTIQNVWLYRKNSTTTWGSPTNCMYWGFGINAPEEIISFEGSWGTSWGTRYCAQGPWALESRFCSRVEYIWTNTGSVEICGVLTNFLED